MSNNLCEMGHLWRLWPGAFLRSNWKKKSQLVNLTTFLWWGWLTGGRMELLVRQQALGFIESH